jgi:hypothetical protein
MSTAAREMGKALEEEKELRLMQLAAISTAAMCNTRETMKSHTIDFPNPYCTVAYKDVVKAIERD